MLSVSVGVFFTKGDPVTFEPVEIGFILSGPEDAWVTLMSGPVRSSTNSAQYLSGLQTLFNYMFITLILRGQPWINVQDEYIHFLRASRKLCEPIPYIDP